MAAQAAGPAAYTSAKTEKGKQLENVIASVKAWTASGSTTSPPMDAFQQMVNIGTSLTTVAMATDPRMESFTAVVGDESAGKTVVTMDLLKQVLLDVQAGTGTTVRTYVKQSFSPELESETGYKFDVSYERKFPSSRTPEAVHKTMYCPNQMLECYMTLSKENRDNIPQKIDCDNVCHVNITCNQPELGLQIMDHPGFAKTLEGPVKETFDKTFKDHFLDPDTSKYNASVLLCHRFGEQRSKAFFPGMCKDYYQQVNEGCMFMAITQIDRLASKSEFETFTKDLKEKKGNRPAEGGSQICPDLLRVTPKDILDFIEQDYLFDRWQVGADDNMKLPGHTRLFFVCSYSGDIGKLLSEPDPKRRYDIFVNHESKGRAKNEATFWETLFNVEKWRAEDIELIVDDKERERAELEPRVGMKHLFKALLSRQTSAMQKVADAAVEECQKKYDTALEAYKRQASLTIPKIHNYANLSQMLMRKFVETYVTLTTNDPLNPEASAFAAQQNIQAKISQEIHRSFSEQKSDLGWSLDEEEKLFDGLRVKGNFPPASKDLVYAEWEEDHEELRPYCIGMAEIDQKHWNISSLIRRFEAQYAMLSCAIKAGDVNIKQLQLDQRTTPSQLSGDLKTALSSHIQRTYEKIYRGGTNEGGNMFVSTRVALICLMHGQSVMKLFKDVTEFQPLLGAKGAVRYLDPDWSSKDDLLKALTKCSRVQLPTYFDTLVQQLGNELSRHAASGHTLLDMIEDDIIMDSSNPMEDFERVVVAQFFDCPYERLDKDLGKVARKYSSCAPAYMAISHHYGPLFIHQSPKFLENYSRQFSGDSFVTKLVAAPGEEESVTEFFNAISDVLGDQVSDANRRAASCKVIKTAGQCSHMFAPMGQMAALEKLASMPFPEEVQQAASAARLTPSSSFVDGFLGGRNQPSTPATASTTASIADATENLTDYEHIHQFMPGCGLTEDQMRDKQKTACDERGIAPEDVTDRVAVVDRLGKRLPAETWMTSVEETQFPITLREISLARKADAFGQDHTEEELYKNMSDETYSLIKSLNKHANVSPKDRAKILASLIKANRVPDTIIPFENAAWPKAWEVEWLNYVVQRQISAATKRTLDDVLQNVASLLYCYQHGTQVSVQLKEARTRWCSLVLGYPYPYLPKERPSSLRFLNPDDVIQFMFRNKADILEYGCKLCAGINSTPQESRCEVARLDYEIRKSPLFKHVVQLASSKEDKERAKAHSTIDRLYDLWFQTQMNQGGDGDDENSSSVEKLTDELMDLLLPVRYADIAERCREHKNLDKAKEKCIKLHEALTCLDRFARFVRQHGASLCTPEDRITNSDLKPLEIHHSEPTFEVFHIGGDAPLSSLAPPIYTKSEAADDNFDREVEPHPYD